MRSSTWDCPFVLLLWRPARNTSTSFQLHYPADLIWILSHLNKHRYFKHNHWFTPTQCSCIVIRIVHSRLFELKLTQKRHYVFYIYIYIYMCVCVCVYVCVCVECWSQWPRGLRRRSAAARLLRSWVRIPPGAWMFDCCWVLCVVR